MLFYITLLDFEDCSGPGKERKIKGQIEAMKEKLGEIYYTKYLHSVLWLMDGEKVVEKQAALTRKDCVFVLCGWIQKYQVTETYIRYFRSSKWFIDLLRYQAEHQITSILELPTYPYDGELKEGMSKIEDACYRREIGRYIDRIATYAMENRIWDIICIRLQNGMALSDVSVQNRKKQEKKIVLIAVGTMKYWQGYERIIEGMHLYYSVGGEYDIRLKIVGEGPEIPTYEDLVRKYELYSKVEFVGRIETEDGERLNEQYALSDIAVSTLGMYKKGLHESSSIKAAEYCAKGIPFIYGYQDFRFPDNWEFAMNVSNGPEPIDIDQVISFYEKVTKDKYYQEKMRDYAIRHLTWNHIMQPVNEYFLSKRVEG